MSTLTIRDSKVRTKVKPSIVLAVAKQTPLQKELIRLFNLGDSAREAGDQEALAALREDAEYMLRVFKASYGDGHDYPDWIIAAEEAQFSRVFEGDLEAAIDHEKRALDCARRDWERALSLTNLCCYHNDLEQFEEAAEFGREAYDLWRATPGMPPARPAAIYLAIASHGAGQTEQAVDVIRHLAQAAELGNPADILTAHAKYETAFQDLVRHPKLSHIFSNLKT